MAKVGSAEHIAMLPTYESTIKQSMFKLQQEPHLSLGVCLVGAWLQRRQTDRLPPRLLSRNLCVAVVRERAKQVGDRRTGWKDSAVKPDSAIAWPVGGCDQLTLEAVGEK